VLILPSLRAVAVVTRTDYNAPSTAGQTIRLVSKFILPGRMPPNPSGCIAGVKDVEIVDYR